MTIHLLYVTRKQEEEKKKYISINVQQEHEIQQEHEKWSVNMNYTMCNYTSPEMLYT